MQIELKGIALSMEHHHQISKDMLILAAAPISTEKKA
jgi:hypothetical protein